MTDRTKIMKIHIFDFYSQSVFSRVRQALRQFMHTISNSFSCIEHCFRTTSLATDCRVCMELASGDSIIHKPIQDILVTFNGT